MPEKAIILAHYLPQFHPVPENDEWWGKGFTEWTNTVKAKPLYPGHIQPNLPSDLGFYDLRVPEIRQQQAELARRHGITGFAYWHYWFGNGRRILERPFNEVLQTGQPDFPFCLAWANESWTGIWHGLKDKTLVEQTYPGETDFIKHFDSLLPAFKDKRYIKIDNKPIFIVYKPQLLPDKRQFTQLWNKLACENGFKGVYFIGIYEKFHNNKIDGFEEKSIHPIPLYIDMYENNVINRLKNRIINHICGRLKKTYFYGDLINNYNLSWSEKYDFIPTILPNWDNTPRAGRNGLIIHGSTPQLFNKHFRDIIMQTLDNKNNINNIVFIKSWNEWAEGNYLEPDSRWGLSYLEKIKDILKDLDVDSTYKY